MSQTIISQRGKFWAAQCIRAREVFKDRARHHQARKNAEAREDYEELSSQLDDLLEKLDKEEKSHPPVCMSSASLNCEDLEHFQRMMENKNFTSPARIVLCRANIVVAPPAVALGDDVGGLGVWCRREPVMPEWCKLFADHREFFGRCALVCQGVFGAEYWKVLYVVQSPRPYVAVCQMQPTGFTCSPLSKKASAADLNLNKVKIAFRCNFGVMKTAADMPAASINDLCILFNVVHRGGVIVAADEEP